MSPLNFIKTKSSKLFEFSEEAGPLVILYFSSNQEDIGGKLRSNYKKSRSFDKDIFECKNSIFLLFDYSTYDVVLCALDQ